MLSNNAIAQFGHAGWGALIVLCFALYGHPLWGIGGVLAWSLPKEFIYDKLVEKQPTLNNVIDFLFYQLGSTSGLIFTLIHKVVS